MRLVVPSFYRMTQKNTLNREKENIMTTIHLWLGDFSTNSDDIISVTPDRIIDVLEVNKGLHAVTLSECSVGQFLDFIRDVQNYAVEKYKREMNEHS